MPELFLTLFGFSFLIFGYFLPRFSNIAFLSRLCHCGFFVVFLLVFFQLCVLKYTPYDPASYIIFPTYFYITLHRNLFRLILFVVGCMFFVLILYSPLRLIFFSEKTAKNFASFYFLLCILLVMFSFSLIANHLLVLLLSIEIISFITIFIMNFFIVRSSQTFSGIYYFFVSVFASIFLLLFIYLFGVFFKTYLISEASFLMSQPLNYDLLLNSRFDLIPLLMVFSLLCFFCIKFGLFPFLLWIRPVYNSSSFLFLSIFNTIIKLFYQLLWLTLFVVFIPFYHFIHYVFMLIVFLGSLIFVSYFLFREIFIKSILGFLSVISNIFFLLPSVGVMSINIFVSSSNLSVATDMAFSLSKDFVQLQTFYGLLICLLTFSLLLLLNFVIFKNKELAEMEYVSDLNFISRLFSFLFLISFVIIVFTLIGIPPLSIWVLKTFIFKKLLLTKQFLLLVFFFIGNIIAAIYYLRLFVYIFFSDVRSTLVTYEKEKFRKLFLPNHFVILRFYFICFDIFCFIPFFG